jgi:hypothetical protein
VHVALPFFFSFLFPLPWSLISPYQEINTVFSLFGVKEMQLWFDFRPGIAKDEEYGD